MAKEVSGLIKLQIRGGAANPSPPVGPALGAKGVNIMEFCKQFNARTQDQAGKVIPVIISVYKDKSFDFIIKTPPVAVQIKEAAKLKSGSPEPNRTAIWLSAAAAAEPFDNCAARNDCSTISGSLEGFSSASFQEIDVRNLKSSDS